MPCRLDAASAGRPHRLEYVSGDVAVIREHGDMLLAGIADVLGHGPEAHAVAVEVEAFLEGYWNDSVVGLLDGLHRHLKGSRGAAAGLCLVNRRTGNLCYAGIGNTVIRRFGTDEVRLLSRPGIVGGERRTPSEERLQMSPGDVVVLYTDGIKDRFGLDDYPELLEHPAQSIVTTLVQRFSKDHDDASCIALRFHP